MHYRKRPLGLFRQCQEAFSNRTDSGSADLHGPAVRIGHAAPLDAGELIVQALGDGADLVAADGDLLVALGQLADGRDHRGGAGAPGLLQSAVLSGLEKFLDRKSVV